MLKETMMKSVGKAISNVLETMFFQPVQIFEGDWPLAEWFSESQLLHGATVRFSGPLSGSSYLLIPVRALRKMTADFLGVGDQAVDEEQNRDTIKEAMNMILGHTLSLCDEKGEFKLGIPEYMDTDSLPADRLEELGGDTVLVKTDDSRMALGIVIV